MAITIFGQEHIIVMGLPTHFLGSFLCINGMGWRCGGGVYICVCIAVLVTNLDNIAIGDIVFRDLEHF